MSGEGRPHLLSQPDGLLREVGELSLDLRLGLVGQARLPTQPVGGDRVVPGLDHRRARRDVLGVRRDDLFRVVPQRKRIPVVHNDGASSVSAMRGAP